MPVHSGLQSAFTDIVTFTSQHTGLTKRLFPATLLGVYHDQGMIFAKQHYIALQIRLKKVFFLPDQ